MSGSSMCEGAGNFRTSALLSALSFALVLALGRLQLGSYSNRNGHAIRADRYGRGAATRHDNARRWDNRDARRAGHRNRVTHVRLAGNQCSGGGEFLGGHRETDRWKSRFGDEHSLRP